jgi:transcriptional regulator with XRE-family HTH domain
MPRLDFTDEERAEQMRLIVARMTLTAEGDVENPEPLITWIMSEFDVARVSAKVLMHRAQRVAQGALPSETPAWLAIPQVAAYGQQFVAAGKIAKVPSTATVRLAVNLGKIAGADNSTGRWLLPRAGVEAWLLENFKMYEQLPATEELRPDRRRTLRGEQDALRTYVVAEMKRRGWNQAALSQACGLAGGQVSNLLNAKRGFEHNTLRALARGLGVSQVFIFRLAGLITETPEEFQGLAQDPDVIKIARRLGAFPQDLRAHVIDILDKVFALAESYVDDWRE